MNHLTPISVALDRAGLRSSALVKRATWMPAFAFRLIRATGNATLTPRRSHQPLEGRPVIPVPVALIKLRDTLHQARRPGVNPQDYIELKELPK